MSESVNAPPPEAAVGLDPATIREVHDALDAGTPEVAAAVLLSLPYADAADLLEALTPEERAVLVPAAGRRLDPLVVSELKEDVREEVVEFLGPKETAAVLQGLDSDDAVEVVQALDEDVQSRVLDAVPEAERRVIEAGLAYPEESAGRLMQREYVALPSSWSVGQTIDYLRDAAELPDDFYDLFLVDNQRRPIGTVPLSRVLRSRRPVVVGAIMEPKAEFVTVPVTMDQEDVAFLFRQRDLVSAPVVDESGRMVGVITVDDVVEVIEEEREEDIMRLGGVAETDLNRSVIDTTKGRFTWLFVNLLTAILASLVIGLFKDSIEHLAALAVLMPIAASMGGNAGSQTLTVVVRGLATREITVANAVRIVMKEILVGSLNGFLFAILGALVAGLWFHDAGLGFVLGAALICNLIAAGLAGALIPLGLHFLKIDPAISSVVFLTTVTDVVGFFAFLGLAAWLLL
ncbi:MAG: magnesium transporter [Alphaproteobacteria bacterium]